MAAPIPQAQEGLAPFTYAPAKKPLQTYYKTFGNLSSSATPLILIHGGPGLSHDSLLAHTSLFTQYSIPLIFYDQIGSGRSTHLPETLSLPNFWTDEIFVAQLTQLISFLNLKRYSILGHSWGGMLLSKFASLRPEGLYKIILANSAASKKLSMANSISFRNALPQETQDIMSKHEKAGTTDSEEYNVIMNAYVKEHVCNVPASEGLKLSLKFASEDETAAKAIGDGGWWNADGFMRDWDTSEDCKKIDVPTLVLHGVGECAGGVAMKPFVDGIPDARAVILEGSTHSPHEEVPEEYTRIVGEFLVK